MTLILFALAFIATVFAQGDRMPSVTRKCGDVSLSETVFPGSYIDEYQVVYLDDLNVVFLLVQPQGQVFRSADEGITWSHISIPRVMQGVGTEGIGQIFASDIAKDGAVTVFFLGANGDGKMWVSRDRGATYKYLNSTIVPTSIYYMYPHHMFPGTALARGGQGDNDARHAVYYVSDYGEKWQYIADVPDRSKIEWSTIGTVSPNRIYLQNFSSATSNVHWESKIIYSDDYFKTYGSLILDHVYQWHIVPPNRLVVTTCKDTVACATKQLWISEDGGNSFHLATFPDRDQQIQDETEVTVFEISDDTMWVNVERECRKEQFKGTCPGDLFHSYAADKAFTLSLEDHRVYDFTKYNSLNGIYIANQYFVEGETDLRSLITFNKGSSWDLIQAPVKDSKGQATNCVRENGCGLHLHGWADGTTYFYSVDNAIGVMVASGNIGKKLETRHADIGIYYSRNGGLNWTEVRQGNWIQEIGDHGSIIVLAELSTLTKKLVYTINDGDEWRECEFTNVPMYVKNIRVDIGWDSKQFILYGSRMISVNGTSTMSAVVVHLNFEHAYPGGKCKPTDLEDYTPQAEHGHCFMGKKTTYQRRKFGTACYYGDDWKPVTKEVRCACTKEDYECATCFFRPALGEMCQRTCGYQTPPTAEQCPKKDGLFYVEDGYILIDGNKCDNSSSGSVVPKAAVSCSYKFVAPPGENSGWSSTIIALIFVAIVWAFLAALFAYLWKNNETFHNFIAGTFGFGVEKRKQGESLQDSDEEVLTPGSEDDGEVVNSSDLGLSDDDQ